MDYDVGRALRRARARGARSRSPCTRRSPASWATSSATRSCNMAVGMLDHSAGIAKAAGAELVVFHPGFLLGRDARGRRSTSVVEQLGELRERLEGKDRAVPFGVEVMGRVRELGIARRRARDRRAARLGPPGARLRAHARDERRRVHRRRAVRRRRSRPPTRVLEPGAPFHIHFSRHRRTRTATRRSTCPTARARCAPSRSREALARFERPATVIRESPDEESTQAIRRELLARRRRHAPRARRSS